MTADPYQWLADMCMPWPPLLPELTGTPGVALPPVPDDCYPPGAVPLPVELLEA